MFAKGQKVVCVRDFVGTVPLVYRPWVKQIPHKGRLYHVAGYDKPVAPLQYIWLAEIDNPRSPFGTQVSFRADFFRPVVERKTDISIFTRMLTPHKETV